MKSIDVRKTKTTKDTKVIISRIFVVKFMKRHVIAKSGGWKDVENMGRHMKSFCPIYGRKSCMKQEGTNGIV